MREVGELLEVDSVGLYELMWRLNGSDFELVEAKKKAIAYTVATAITNAGQAQVYELAWTSGTILDGPLDLTTRIGSADAWPSEASEQYLALVP